MTLFLSSPNRCLQANFGFDEAPVHSPDGTKKKVPRFLIDAIKNSTCDDYAEWLAGCCWRRNTGSLSHGENFARRSLPAGTGKPPNW